MHLTKLFDMELSAQAASVEEILSWRELYRAEMNSKRPGGAMQSNQHTFPQDAAESWLRSLRPHPHRLSFALSRSQ